MTCARFLMRLISVIVVGFNFAGYGNAEESVAGILPDHEIVEFSVRERAEDAVEFHFEVESRNLIAIPRYRLAGATEVRSEENCIYRCPRNLSLADRKKCRSDPASYGFKLEKVCPGTTSGPEVFSGRYRTQGVNEDGLPYEGETVIVRIWHEEYKIIQNIAGDQIAGYGFIDGLDRLVVEFADVGICAAYVPGPDGRLDGEWGAECDQWTGKERLLPF